MQSIEFKRFTAQRIGIAVAAIGTLAIVLTGTGTLFDVNGDSDGSASTVSRTTQQTSSIDTMRFLEWNTNLPEVSTSPVQSWAEAEPLELNMTPPGTVRPSVRSYDETRFLEMNTFLPGTTTPAVMSSEDMRFLEMNQLPGDDDPYLPAPGGSSPAGALTDY